MLFIHYYVYQMDKRVVEEDNFRNMTINNSDNQQLMQANDPEAVYAKSPTNHQPWLSTTPALSCKGRMTVEEFCNELHTYVDEYYDSLQG